jgi:response regulator of citrate/malate metabolism
LDQKDIACHQALALAAQRLKTSTLLVEKQQKMNQQQNHLEGIQELAFDVVVKHDELSKLTAKTTKEAQKKAAAEETATKRLLKYKQDRQM